MIAVLVLVLAVAAVAAAFYVIEDPKRRMIVANLIGMAPAAYDGLMQFLGNFTSSAQSLELSHYVSPQYLMLYFVVLCGIDALVHLRGNK